MKEEKGITLVALIITIIVLLILAVVTISAVNEGSLFVHANNAATAYSEKAIEENTMISNYISDLGKYDKDGSNNSTQGSFPAEYFGRFYKRDENDSSYGWTFIQDGNNIKGYAIDVDYNNIDKQRTFEKITYSNFISQLDATGLEYDLNIQNASVDVFSNVNNEESEKDFLIFYDDYTKCAWVEYYYEDENDYFIEIDDSNYYILQSADYIDVYSIIE